MIYWITKGYVVLDDASFPIIGEGENQPNDSFRTQLVANAKAAIEAVNKGIRLYRQEQNSCRWT